jgi:hypothetical protein
MKKINNKFLLLFSLIASLVFTNCEQQENITFDNNNGFVQFAQTEASIVENSADPIEVTVLFGGSAEQNSMGITVNYELTSADTTRYTVTPAGGTLMIPAGEVEANILLTPINNLFVDGNADISISLAASSSVPVGLGGAGLAFNTLSITIVDDDCPISINDFVGTYSVDENFTAGRNSPSGLNDFFGESYQLEMVLDPTDVVGNKLIVTNSAGFNQYVPNGTVLTFDTCNGKVTFDGANSVNLALFRDYEYTDSSYDENNFIIKATGPLSTFGEYQFTFTKM